MEKLHSELKKEFQLERLILFSDAIFAIAITLLVIEIKVPELDRHTATDDQLAHSLAEMIPKFIGFFISFFIIGLYWTIHHRMFGFVINYTRRLLWLNLLFLLGIVLMPFSTAFYSAYVIRFLKIPVIVYVVNIVFLGLMNYILWSYLSNPKQNLVEGLDERERKYFSFRAITVPFIFTVTALVYLFIAPKVAVWIPPLTPLFMRIVRMKYEKRIRKGK
jgi:uncharacterized membrane protein